MRVSVVFVAAVLAAVVAVASAEGGARAMTGDSWKETTEGDTWFVKLYAPWCGHCKRLAPTWDELAEKLDGQVNVVKVDCTVHENVCKALNVKGYPTLKLIKGDRMQTYKGARDVETLAEFALNQDWEAETGYETTPTVPDPAAARAAIQAKADAAAEEAEAGGEVLELTASNFGVLTGSGLTFVKFYAPWCGHCKRLAPTWDELAVELNGKVNVGKVDCTIDKTLCSDFGVRGYPTLKMVKDGKKVLDYSGGRDLDTLKTWATGASWDAAVDMPKLSPAPKGGAAKEAAPAAKKGANANSDVDESDVVVLDKSNIHSSITDGNFWLVEIYADWCGHCKKLIPTYAETATALKGKAKVAKINGPQNPRIQRGFNARGFPTIFGTDGTSFYTFSGKRTVENFTAFVEGGYKEAEAVPLPGPPGAMDTMTDLWHQYFKFAEDFLERHLIPALEIVLGFGILLGFMLGRLTAPAPAAPAPAPAPVKQD